MKKILLTTAATLLTVAAFGQGSVTFQNASTIAGWNPVADRNVRFDATAIMFNPALTAGTLVTSNHAGVTDLAFLRAALYYAPGANVTDIAAFQPASGGTPATFKPSTSTTPGSWFGGTRTLDTIAPSGGAATLVVFVWDSRLGSDPKNPQVLAGLYGRSEFFNYTTPTAALPGPADFLPNNLTAFTIGIIPEPSSFALAGLGAAALLIFRRRK